MRQRLRLLSTPLCQPNAEQRHSKGNVGARFATQQSAELLQNSQLETTGCLQLSFVTLLQSMCSLSHLLTMSEQPCYRAGFTAYAACSDVSVLLLLRAYM